MNAVAQLHSVGGMGIPNLERVTVANDTQSQGVSFVIRAVARSTRHVQILSVGVEA